MKSTKLRKIELLNKRNPSTISQWLRYRQEYRELSKDFCINETCPPFTLGYLMPVGERGQNLIPSGKSHLFSIIPNRFKGFIDENNVSRRTGRGWRTVSYGKHEIRIESVAVFKGRKLEWLMAPSDVVKSFILPEGWTWKKDEYGICAVDSENIDYHPIWSDDITIENILESHSLNKENRKKYIEEQAIKHHLESIFRRDINNTYVNLFDSRKAGNCVEGSLSFAEKRLKMNREDILNGGYLCNVNASVLIKSGDSRAINAARCAWERETTISI